MSSGVATWPTGVVADNCFHSFRITKYFSIEICIDPSGAKTQFTVIPNGASSDESDFVNDICPLWMPRNLKRSPRPADRRLSSLHKCASGPLFLFRCGIAERQTVHVPFKLMRMVLSQSSSSICSARRSLPNPCVANHESTLPKMIESSLD